MERDESLRILLKETMIDLTPIGASHPSEVEAIEGVWAGGDNIHMNIDFPKEVGGDAVVTGQEILDIVGESSSSMYNDKFIAKVIREAIRASQKL